jgi:hypothetical protein
LEKLIEMNLVDGTLTDKEKQVLLKTTKSEHQAAIEYYAANI